MASIKQRILSETDLERAIASYNAHASNAEPARAAIDAVYDCNYISRMPHNQTEAQKLRRVNWCRKMMHRFANGDSNAVYDITTGKESLIYCYDPETKRQSAPSVFPFEELPTKVKRDRSVGKKMVASFLGSDRKRFTDAEEAVATYEKAVEGTPE
ncbi:hypothetical protein EVAR_78528_1 [Eumeta japonica]|uniref:Mariner Mos1 transposase n=1 Tax=Eumeta variegata TaxID=151549 RepID=A0A4C1W647_EUMVA|nr:hypothetical protein EVAR_78528_1 [Eumeta japonica]